MKKNFYFLGFLFLLFSCSDMELINNEISEYKHVFQKEIEVFDKAGLNSIFLRITGDSVLVENYVKKNDFFIELISEVKELGDLTGNGQEFLKNANKLGNDSGVDFASLPQINFEAIATKFEEKAAGYFLNIKEKEKVDSAEKDLLSGPAPDWITYPVTIGINSGSFAGVVHTGQGRELMIRMQYKTCWACSWQQVEDANGQNAWFIYPETHLPYYSYIYRDDFYATAIAVNQYYYDGMAGLVNYKWAYRISEFYGRTCSNGGYYDGANCYIGAPPSGSTAFIYGNSFYYTPLKGNFCPLSGSYFDGANCFFQSIPAGSEGFVYQNKWYLKPDKILVSSL